MLCQFAENDGLQVHPCPYKGHELFFFLGRKGGKEDGREEGRDEGRKEGKKGGGRVEGKERREGRKSSNERDIADLDLEVYKLISFFSFFERRKEKEGVKERKKEEEKN